LTRIDLTGVFSRSFFFRLYLPSLVLMTDDDAPCVGCFALTASSLNSLLIFSPNLTDLVLLGLSSVNRGTLAQIGASCHNLQKLDVSRCKNLPATSLFYLPYPPRKAATSSIWPRPSGGLRSLKASKLSGMNAEVLFTILDRFPDLETLDVSFNPGINDDAVRRAVSRAPVSLSDSHRNPFAPASTLFLPNLATSSPSSSSSKRVYPSLRHLDLSACALLTSTGLSRLAHSLPTLEILELSRIGPSLRSAGLVEFLSSTPLLRKLDLEDADSLTDDVLFSLAANAPSLTHLLISSCSSFTDVGLSAIATQCEKLRVLEADGTAMGADTARRYIALAKVRAMKAQEEAATAAEGGEDIDPLVRSKYPAVLSVLDSRTVARRLSRELAKGLVRTRNGQRGYWTGAAAGFYLDEGVEDFESGVAGEEEDLRKAGKHALDECDETKVVVRSFYSSLAVDAALALREAKEGEEEGAGKKKGRSGLRSRAMSAPEVWRGDEGRGCIVS
jgi:F-box/leucine-rich repeat protein 2/20